MKQIKSFLVFTIILVSTSILAQSRSGGKQNAPTIPNDKQIEKIMSSLSNQLAFSDEQSVKILALHKAYFAQVKEKISDNKRPNRQQMEALESTFEKQVKAELTKEQVSNYEILLKTKKPQRNKKSKNQ